MGIFDTIKGEAKRNFIARADEAKGEIPKACVVLKPGSICTESDLKAHAQRELGARVIEEIKHE